MSWIAHIDELIKAGKNAVREESAVTLEVLLDLTPDDCWSLLQARDPCLDKLTADAYQYLLNKTVAARASTGWSAPLFDPRGAVLDHTEGYDGHQRGNPGGEKTDEASVSTLVTPKVVRRRTGLECLANWGKASGVDTDTLTDMIH